MHNKSIKSIFFVLAALGVMLSLTVMAASADVAAPKEGLKINDLTSASEVIDYAMLNYSFNETYRSFIDDLASHSTSEDIYDFSRYDGNDCYILNASETVVESASSKPEIGIAINDDTFYLVPQYSKLYPIGEYSNAYIRTPSNLEGFEIDKDAYYILRVLADEGSGASEYSAQYLIQKIWVPEENGDYRIAITFQDNGIAEKKIRDIGEMRVMIKTFALVNNLPINYEKLDRNTLLWSDSHEYFLSGDRRGVPVVLIFDPMVEEEYQ